MAQLNKDLTFLIADRNILLNNKLNFESKIVHTVMLNCGDKDVSTEYLCEYLGETKETVENALKELEKQGLVTM